MKVSQWAEIRRLAEVEGLSQRQIAERLRCCWRTVKKALAMPQPPDETRRPPRGSILDPHKPKIDALIAKYPQLSAVRVLEEIRKGPEGYTGQISVVRSYLRQIRPIRQRIYQEVFYEPGQALQVDWGSCGYVKIGATMRRVSVFVAVLCYSRLCYIEFCLSERKAEFYRWLVQALKFFGGSPTANHLRQPEGRGPERFRKKRLLASGLFGAVRPLLSAAHRLRASRPGIEGSRGGESSLRKKERPAGPRRGTDVLGRLWTSGDLLARPSGQRARSRHDQGASGRSFPKGTELVAPLAGGPLRYRRNGRRWW